MINTRASAGHQCEVSASARAHSRSPYYFISYYFVVVYLCAHITIETKKKKTKKIVVHVNWKLKTEVKWLQNGGLNVGTLYWRVCLQLLLFMFYYLLASVETVAFFSHCERCCYYSVNTEIRLKSNVSAVKRKKWFRHWINCSSEEQ